MGVIAITAAAINDVVGWLLLALVTTLTASNFIPGRFAFKVRRSLFVLVSIMVVRPILKRVVRRSNPRDGHMSANLLGGMLLVVFAGAMATSQIGIFAIFGGFMMGVILFDEKELVAAWRVRVGDFVTVFFLPIFFTYTGLRTSIGALDAWDDWALVPRRRRGGDGHQAGRRLLGGAPLRLQSRRSAIIGFMMNTRALMELIVINVGFDLGVITAKMFTMLVIMAIVSTVITTPALRRYLSRTGPLPLAAGSPHTIR